jgi:peptidase C39-like protein
VPHVHEVPMCRQRIEPTEWHKHDGPSLGDRIEWSNRACGMATLRMILLAYGLNPPTLTELLHLGVQHGGLTDRGWIHARIAEIATNFGIPSRAEAVDIEDLPARLTTAPMIISVAEKLPADGRRGGHLIIARGWEDTPERTIHIRDPSSWGQHNNRASLRQVAASYSGRAITFTPLPGNTPSPPSPTTP